MDDKNRVFGGEFGIYLSGFFSGTTINRYKATEDRPARTVCKWGVGDGSAESRTVYVSEDLCAAVKPMVTSPLFLKVEVFPAGKDVGFRLRSVVEGTTIKLEDGTTMTASQLNTFLAALG